MTGAILLATYNGAEWLPEQLDSFLTQDTCDWHLHVSDDGSTDATLNCVDAFGARAGGRLATVGDGPRRGACRNFLGLLTAVPDDVDWVAFSDQDDVWHSRKLSRALASLASAGSTPCLYAARTFLCSADLKVIGKSPMPGRPPSFANALVQSLAGGNTMVLNRAGLRLAQAHVSQSRSTISHDWWLYQLMTALGARVIYDPIPSVYYRQHTRNLVGSNHTMAAQAKRFSQLCRGRFRDWTDANIAALAPARAHFTPEARRTFDAFCEARDRPGVSRLKGFVNAGVHRQTRAQSASLGAAALLGLV